MAESIETTLIRQTPSLDRHALTLALHAQAAAWQRGLLSDPTTLTLIDYSLPSYVPRLWVIDLVARRVIFEELVAHGRNSGAAFATRFSNLQSSLQSSLGLFVTQSTYRMGRHGQALRLQGLEAGFNDRALARGIVIHASKYVSTAIAANRGQIGRSWGCPALSNQAAPRVIARIRNGSAVFAYYPDQHWLGSSVFLRPAPAAVIAIAPAAVSRIVAAVATGALRPVPAA